MEGSLLPRSILTVILLTFLCVFWFALEGAGVRRMLIVGWLIVVAMMILWGASLFDWISGKVGKYCLIIGLVVAFLTILGGYNILQRAVPFCGDGVCTTGECNSGCKDCSAERCDDGQCQLLFENCKNDDCPCDPGKVCAPARTDTDERGCYVVGCGDSLCDSGEDLYTCCADCGCQPGYACERNICYFQPPKITFTSYILSDKLSATTLAANPWLTDEDGKTNPLMGIVVRNSVSRADNVKATFAIPGFASETFSLGTLQAGEEVPVLWYLAHIPEFLTVTEAIMPNITLTLSYEDLKNLNHSTTWMYDFTILPRNVLDEYGNLAFFVTPNDVNVQTNTAKGIWNELQKKVRFGEDKEQFPIETLDSGSGGQRDIAVLLASAYVKAGLRTSLVESKEGVFLRVLDKDGYVILDPRKFDDEFLDAMTRTPGYAVHEIDETWETRNSTVLSLG